jgi:hypothetical protein
VNRSTAEKLIDAANRIDVILEELGGISHEISDETERKKIRHGIAIVIIDLYEGMTREVAQQFPDLHPDLPSKESGSI